MAMNAVTLGKALADCVASSDAPSEQKAQIVSTWTNIASEIIKHISSNATITVASGIAVSTTGTAAAQTGVTTSTGTATIA